ncbi:hypothetical protein NDN08_007487 [Rhodosorus marinus]|uniref:Uncharacterized protein n=1 Tax=Rhodosorus marinus TaxID=101924 RepID=A0AAV8UZ84_9RHOD|nr:hypothetical protein NDN08_007487 [Rhodosorus marinus]
MLGAFPMSNERDGYKRIPVSALLSDAGEEFGGDSPRHEEELDSPLAGEDNPLSQPTRMRWTPSEDRLLKQLVDEHGAKNWSKLAEHFPRRHSRQVRLRWMNHLSPDIDDREWTVSEDKIIMETQKRFGNRWSLIARRLPGRSDNATKNRYNRLMRMREARGRRRGASSNLESESQ